MELTELTVHAASEALARRQVSSRELTQAYLDRIGEVDGRVAAFITVTAEEALRQAEEADRRRAAGESGPLLGVPAAIKDVICTRGVRSTAGSRMLERFVPVYDAHVMERLQQAGMVMLGKTNMDEFAMGSSTENSAFFPTHNPWDLERVPGGSSGGSAAAVAAREAAYALGSDTGGSIRQPAALCGVVGIKPTYGRVSRYGLIAFASSLDQIGPITRDVRDAALVLGAIAGHDPRDSTSAPLEVPDYAAELGRDVRGLRVGVPEEYLPPELDTHVRERVVDAVNTLAGLGCKVEWEMGLPATPYALATYYIIAPSEASANLARYDGVKYGFAYQGGASMWENMERTRQEGFGDEVKRRIMLGTYSLSAGYYDAFYLKALRVRSLVRQEFDAAFQRVDVLAVPTSPTVAFRLGEKVEDPLAMYLSDIFTLPVNIAGLPAISVPCGLADGLPVGLQLIGKPFAEAALLRVAHAYERSTPRRELRPPL